MDVKSIATGILSTGHWPAHLGVNTDAEKIEWLARQLEKLAANDDGDILDCDECELCEVHG